MSSYLYRWATPPKVNPEATHQIVRFFITDGGVTTESGYSQMWDQPEITKELVTGQTFTLDVQEAQGELRSPWSNPATGQVADDPVWPPPPPPPTGLPNTPATPQFLGRDVLL